MFARVRAGKEFELVKTHDYLTREINFFTQAEAHKLKQVSCAGLLFCCDEADSSMRSYGSRSLDDNKYAASCRQLDTS